jgi:hypothetical protein
MKRFLGLMLAVAVIGGVAGASQARSGSRHDEGRAAAVELTYTKWFAPGFPNMVGVVGGDITGRFGGAVIQATPTGHLVQLEAVYIVIAPDPDESFTAHVEGVQDNQTHTAVLDGRVVDGYLKRAHVHAEFAVISCIQAPNGRCFEGTISVTRSSEDSGD